MLPIEQRCLTRKFKEELILEANALRVLKQDTKVTQKDRKPAGHLQSKIHTSKFAIRHRHLAYCMLRGKTYEQCERKVREGNKANMLHVKKIIQDYTYVKIEETIPVAA